MGILSPTNSPLPKHYSYDDTKQLISQINTLCKYSA